MGKLGSSDVTSTVAICWRSSQPCSELERWVGRPTILLRIRPFLSRAAAVRDNPAAEIVLSERDAVDRVLKTIIAGLLQKVNRRCPWVYLETAPSEHRPLVSWCSWKPA